MHLSAEPLYIGADECGLGALAGPMVVCAAACTAEQNATGIRCKDSKKYGGMWMTGKKPRYREAMPADIIASKFLCYKIVEVCPDDICRWGYSAALGYAFRLAIASVRYALRPRFPVGIIDGVRDHTVPFVQCYPKADKNWPVVSLASCLAKQRQLLRMRELHERYTSYGFLRHAGYGTERHMHALRQFGAVPHVHRIPIIAKMKGMQTLKLNHSPPKELP